MERSYSEGDIFAHSWDYLNKYDKSTNMNGAEAALLTLQSLSPPSETVTKPKLKRKNSKKKASKRQIVSKNTEESEEIQIITPREATETVQENTISCKINAEGRRIIERATLDQLVQAFSEESQGIFIFLIIV